jgi:uncharacterized membrane protein YhaH (DUF805 family)
MDWQAIFDNYRRNLTVHYFDVNGRVGRAEFWYFVLANLVAAILVGIAGGITGLPLGPLFNLAVLLPSTCIGARRLHDTGRSALLVWGAFILSAVLQVVAFFTFLGAMFGAWPIAMFYGGLGSVLGLLCFCLFVALIWFWCQKGVPLPNAYGPPPLAFDPSAKPSPVA